VAHKERFPSRHQGPPIFLIRICALSDSRQGWRPDHEIDPRIMISPTWGPAHIPAVVIRRAANSDRKFRLDGQEFAASHLGISTAPHVTTWLQSARVLQWHQRWKSLKRSRRLLGPRGFLKTWWNDCETRKSLIRTARLWTAIDEPNRYAWGAWSVTLLLS